MSLGRGEKCLHTAGRGYEHDGATAKPQENKNLKVDRNEESHPVRRRSRTRTTITSTQ